MAAALHWAGHCAPAAEIQSAKEPRAKRPHRIACPEHDHSSFAVDKLYSILVRHLDLVVGLSSSGAMTGRCLASP